MGGCEETLLLVRLYFFGNFFLGRGGTKVPPVPLAPPSLSKLFVGERSHGYTHHDSPNSMYKIIHHPP